MITELLPKEGRILCAVSGGVDSMYLLCRLRELGCDVAAAHYNHGLRGAESERDEEFVRAFCREGGIPFCAERGDVAAAAAADRTGTEETARRMRYEFLARSALKLGAAVIATAHTADDNCETILLNLTRGTGLRGLCGIPPVRGNIIRPMLDVTRREAEEYLAARHIPHVEDSTNAGDLYARNRIRHHVMPTLRALNPALSSAVGRAAALLRRDEEYLSDLAHHFLEEHAENNTLDTAALLGAPLPVASRAVRRMAGRELSAAHVDAVLKIARDGGQTDAAGMRVACWRGKLWFGAGERAPLPMRELPAQGVLCLPEAKMCVSSQILESCPAGVHNAFNIFYFKSENICGRIKIASRLEGDSLRPAGRGCTKPLKQLFQEHGIPPWARNAIPVLRDEAGVIGVFGIGAAERAAAESGNENVRKIEFTPYGGCEGEI